MQKYFILFFLLAAIACSDDQPLAEPEFSDPDWIRLEIPTGREAYAIAGSIDDTLLVTTWTKAYYTVDRGETWTESKDFSGPVWGLLEQDGSIFALPFTGYDNDGIRYASVSQHTTPDFGRTWFYSYDHMMRQRIGYATSSTGVTFFLQNNTTPVSPGSNTSYINPTTVIRKTAAGEKEVRLPDKHHVLNLRFDTQDRLYLAVSGSTYQEDSNTFYCCNDDMPAIVYISKQPMGN